MNSGKGSCIRAVGFVLAAFLCQMANLLQPGATVAVTHTVPR